MRLASVLAAAILAASIAAHADTVFNIDGVLQSGDTFAGTISFMSTGGILNFGEFTGVDIRTSSGAIFDRLGYQSINTGQRYNTAINGINSDSAQLTLIGLLPSTFDGASLCSISNECDYTYFNPLYAVSYFMLGGVNDCVESGSITPLSASVTPEPSSFLLFATGLLGVSVITRRQYT